MRRTMVLFASVLLVVLIVRQIGWMSPAVDAEVARNLGERRKPPIELAATGTKVDVALHIMSQCPDAAYCIKAFRDVVAQVAPIIDFKTEYIGSVSGDNVRCMHGENECHGNMYQLCARKLDTSKQFNWYNMIQCQSANLRGIPNNALSCAEQSGIDMDGLTMCVDREGTTLLRASIALSAERGIRRSCTIWINNAVACIRDGSSWYSCPGGHETNDFIRQICKAYGGADAPPACSNL